MYYSAGHNRSLMIILLVAYIIQVVGATPLKFPATDPAGAPPPAHADPSTAPPFQLLEATRRAAASLLRNTARVSDNVLWSAGKLLLTAGESINRVWDAVLHSSVRLLKAGGEACGSIAGRLAHVPVIGPGASGVSEVVSVAVDAVASNVAHDTAVRGQALAKLNARLDESGARLRPVTEGPAVTFFPSPIAAEPTARA